MIEHMDDNARQAFRNRLERVLSDILSAKYDCNITIRLKEKPEYEGGVEK